MSRPPALRTCLLTLCFAALPVFAGSGADPQVLEYVRQTRVQRGKARYVVDVTVAASLPALSKKGVLRAIKRQAPQGQLYESMKFEGDGLVKTNIIARYLQAEFENQRPEEKLATEISPLNYQFNLKGEERIEDRDALVYEVKPLRKRSGLFKGKVWLDKETLLPLREQGKLENVPSVWIKEIVFTREYHLEHGLSLPSAIHSEVNTRIVGKSVINIEFSHYQLMDQADLLQVVSEATSQQDR